MLAIRSAEPDLEVEARLPCLETRRSEEARMEAVVEMLKVLWASPPVPTMSHCLPHNFSQRDVFLEDKGKERG